MAKLDFSALNKIAYRGFETEDERELRDKLIDMGFTITEEAENPFLQASDKASVPLSSSATHEASSTPKQASEHKREPFMRASGGADYNAMYRAAHDFHKMHDPPTIDLKYWKTHTAGIDDTPEAELDYWRRTAEDVSSTAKAYRNDPFLIDLLAAVYAELERAYKTLRDSAQKQPSETA